MRQSPLEHEIICLAVCKVIIAESAMQTLNWRTIITFDCICPQRTDNATAFTLITFYDHKWIRALRCLWVSITDCKYSQQQQFIAKSMMSANLMEENMLKYLYLINKVKL